MFKTTNVIPISRSLLSSRFVLSVIFLLLACIGLERGVRSLATYYGKKPISINRSLREFDPSRLPSFKSGWNFSWINESAKDIGTDEYIFIRFTRKDTNKEPKRVELFVTYYSDPKDKVPHTPDVCGRQEGRIVKEISNIIINASPLTPQCPQIKACSITFDTHGSYATDIYFFVVDGQIKYTRGQVRWVMAKPGSPHTYFSKIEAFAPYSTDVDSEQATEICKTLLCEALPILLSEHFPSKEQIMRR